MGASSLYPPHLLLRSRVRRPRTTTPPNRSSLLLAPNSHRVDATTFFAAADPTTMWTVALDPSLALKHSYLNFLSHYVLESGRCSQRS